LIDPEERKARRREYLRGYYKKNKDAHAASVKRYVFANIEKIKLYRQEWARRNKEKVAEHNRRSKARNREKLPLYGLMSKPGAVEFLEKKRNGCVYCGSHDELHVDHVYPKSRGGAHAIENFQWLCRKCNRAKSDLTEEEFFAHVETLYLKRHGPGL
jgi:5-methylcytosine-specific restriction endonuclease McrA